MTNSEHGTGISRTLLALLMLAAISAGPARATDRTCLTGTDPSVAVDGGQIDALETQIAAACPCASFDGSEGKRHRDYLKCVSPRIRTAIENGALRSKCKSRVAKAHKLSTCGIAGVIPCVENKGDKIRCRITTVEKCLSDERYSRVSCPDYTRCIDAGDTNGDMVVGVGDSGACILPTATPTQTAPQTPTSTATDTPTGTPTDTSTPTPTPEPEDFGWTFCANIDETCTTPGGRAVRFGSPGHYVTRFVPGTTVLCNEDLDPEGISGFVGDPHCDYFVDAPTRTPTNTATPTSTATITPTFTPEADWVICAAEGETCNAPPHHQVRYGQPGHYVDYPSTVLGPILCANSVFGDPYPGNAKRCEYSLDEVPSPTPTRTPTITATATATPTVTTAPPTPTPPPTWVFCAHANETCTLPFHDQLVSMGLPSDGGYNNITKVAGTSVVCSPEALFPGEEILTGNGDCYYLANTCRQGPSDPVAVFVTNRFTGEGSNYLFPSPVTVPPFPDNCFNGNGCTLPYPLTGQVPQEIAVLAVDPRICGPEDREHLSIHWTIRYPAGEVFGDPVFAPQGITGYYAPILEIAEMSMPTLDVANTRYWRLDFQVTQDVHPDYPNAEFAVVRNYKYQIRYLDSEISVGQSVECQSHYTPHPACFYNSLLHAAEGAY